MDIENPHMWATQTAGNRWVLVVKATETFLPVEISSGFEYEDWVTLWEWDDTDHDHILNWRAERFRPTSLRHTWEWTTNIPRTPWTQSWAARRSARRSLCGT